MSELPECRGACCRNPFGACFHRHVCTFHAAETVATLNPKTMYRDPVGNIAAARVDAARSSRRKQRKP